MSILSNIFNSRAVRNAVQQTNGSNNGIGYNNLYTNNINYKDLFYGGINKAGHYDNYYGDASRIISVAAECGLYYVDKNNDIAELKEGTFAYYLDKPNENYPLTKVLEQIYSELITHGKSDIFLWRKDGSKETNIFDKNKKYDENLFRGLTLVSGYDQNRLTKSEKENIITITLGASQSNVFMGSSPSQAAESWRKMQDEMGLHMTAFARNAGMPIGQWLITANSPEEYVKIKDKLEEKTSGAKNNGKVLYSYVPSDAKQAQIVWQQFTSKDVQDYTKQLEFSEKKMSQSFGVPGTIKGTNDGENYATARVSEQVFMKYTIKTLVNSLKEQLQFQLEKRFTITGEIKSNIVIPEIADESLVKIQATTQQVALFDQKIMEGYTPESIVAAFNLPESFLLLEKVSTANNSIKTPSKASKQAKNHNHKHDEFYRYYQNALTEREREEIERDYRRITKEFADEILADRYTELLREDYVGKMSAEFSNKYPQYYNKALDEVAAALVETLGTVDVADLKLTDEELEYAREQYSKRVNDFSKTFVEGIEALEGETLEVRQLKAQPNIERVVVTESEHTRIVSELNSWTKAEKEFPVRVWKTWKALPDACPDCAAINGTTIDVTALFINNPSNEIYEVTGGGLHPNCRCIVVFEMEASEVRDV